MNTAGTSGNIGKKLTQACSCIVRAPTGYVIGPFDNAQTAAKWAAKMWPDLEQNEDGTGDGWDIELLWQP